MEGSPVYFFNTSGLRVTLTLTVFPAAEKNPGIRGFLDTTFAAFWWKAGNLIPAREKCKLNFLTSQKCLSLRRGNECLCIPKIRFMFTKPI